MEKRPVSEISESKPLKPSVSKSLESKWFEAGELPPVGIECEYLCQSNNWVKCEIIFTSEYVVVIQGKAHLNELVQVAFNFGDWPKFRPIKTDKEKVIEAAMNIGGLRARDGAKEVYGALYDAGMLVLPPANCNTKA